MPELTLNKHLIHQIYSSKKAEQTNAVNYIIENYESNCSEIDDTLRYIKTHAVFLGQESYARCMHALMKKQFFKKNHELLDLYTSSINNLAKSRKKSLALDLYISWMTNMPVCNKRLEWLNKNINNKASTGWSILPKLTDKSSILANKITNYELLESITNDMLKCTTERYSSILRLLELSSKKVLFSTLKEPVLISRKQINDVIHKTVVCNAGELIKNAPRDTQLLWFIMECKKKDYLNNINTPPEFLYVMYKNLNKYHKDSDAYLNECCLAQTGMDLDKIKDIYPEHMLSKQNTWKSFTSKVTYHELNQMPEM